MNGVKQYATEITYGRSAQNRTDANYSQYKLLRNKCTSLRQKAIMPYFRKKSLAQDQDPTHFWTTFRPFLHSRKSQQANIFLRENGRVITDKQSIDNIFNKHFMNITSNIKEPVSDCDANFEDHPSISAILTSLPEDASSSFDFTLLKCYCQRKPGSSKRSRSAVDLHLFTI